MKTATSIEDSKRLLVLGIDPNTADMTIISKLGKREERLIATPYVEEKTYPHVAEEFCTPAWSLSSLIGLLPKKVDKYASYTSGLFILYKVETPRVEVGYMFSGIGCINSDLFTACIDLIEQLVKQGYIKTKNIKE